MLRKLIYLFAFLVIFVPPAYAKAQNGYSETVNWWLGVQRDLQDQLRPVKQLHADTARVVGADSSKLAQQFSIKLSERFPGSIYTSSTSIVALNGYTRVGVNASFKPFNLRQQFDLVEKIYDFNRNTFQYFDGLNRFHVTINPRDARKSRYAVVLIPELEDAAVRIWKKRNHTPLAQPSEALLEIFNNVYRDVYARQGWRLDQFASRVITEAEFRVDFLNQADRLYTTVVLHLPNKTPAESVRNQQTRPPNTAPAQIARENAKALVAVEGFFSSILTWMSWIFAAAVLMTLLKLAASAFLLKKTKRFGYYVAKEVLVAGRDAVLNGRGEAKDFSWGPSEVVPSGTPLPGEDGVNEVSDYESCDFLNSKAEHMFLHVLQQVVDTDHYHINFKTRLADIIQVRPGLRRKSKQYAFYRISQKHVDFVLVDIRTSRIVGVIELDDASHLRRDRKKRDELVDQVLTSAGIPILHVRCRADYPRTELEQQLFDRFGIMPREYVLG